MTDPRIQAATQLMEAFAERTGLTSDQPPRRYLWTDAFAVCNLVGLTQLTGQEHHLDLAVRLVDQVHEVLGRHREDDPRSGWISGLGEAEGEAHPTRGGLRIGKPLPERGPGDPVDERLEWDRDGQYFHYLTKWMHALNQMARMTRDHRYSLWARELAVAAYRGFTYSPGPGLPPAMHWKMSIDLSRPLVPSMGQHDPLDGYITCLELQTTASRLPGATPEPDLNVAIHAFAGMAAGVKWASPDPLGIGGLLADAWRLWQLAEEQAPVEPAWLTRILQAALAGLQYYAQSGELQSPADYRLGFRELGLAIGMQAVERLSSEASDPGLRDMLQALARYVPIGAAIEAFWRDPAHQRAGTWQEHRDINEVMLATRLVPDGYLDLNRH